MRKRNSAILVRLYRDEPEISDYAISAIDYCIQQGIVKGTQKDFFSQILLFHLKSAIFRDIIIVNKFTDQE